MKNFSGIPGGWEEGSYDAGEDAESVPWAGASRFLTCPDGTILCTVYLFSHLIWSSKSISRPHPGKKTTTWGHGRFGFMLSSYPPRVPLVLWPSRLCVGGGGWWRGYCPNLMASDSCLHIRIKASCSRSPRQGLSQKRFVMLRSFGNTPRLLC